MEFTMKVSQAPLGSLIKWVDYLSEPPLEHVGVLIQPVNERGFIEVISSGMEIRWYAYQCEVIA
jgi:hypothetical protein